MVGSKEIIFRNSLLTPNTAAFIGDRESVELGH